MVKSKKIVPHVVLLIGPHVPGVEPALLKIIAAEKPSEVLCEGATSASTQNELLSKFKRSDLPHPEDYAANVSKVARDNGAKFSFVEHLSDFESKHCHDLVHEADAHIQVAIDHSRQGNLENALDSVSSCFTRLSQLERFRSERFVRKLSRKASNADGRPILALVGSAHSSIIKPLVKNGVKVTVYQVIPADPVTSGLISSNYGTLSRSNLTRTLFQQFVIDLLKERCGFQPKHVAFSEQLMPSLVKLRSIPLGEFEKFISSMKGSNPNAFDFHFVRFLKNKGVNLPTAVEAEKIRANYAYGPVRKVKTFEPKSP